MRGEDDALLAEFLLRRGMLDAPRLRRAVELCQAARSLGVGHSLLEILAQKGFLGERELRQLEAELGLDHLARPDHAGELGGYRILGKLEPWGLGAVFRGLQVSMQRPVALKVIAPAAARDAEFLERFLSEARTAGQADHPNVVGALDLGRLGEHCYYATELLEAPDLGAELRGGPLPVARALAIARQVAQALAHIHELGFTHRDVQPANILVLPDGTVRLKNLGAARQPGDPSVARTGIPIGTPGYSAPELLAPTPSADIRSDLYALGATLHHCLTGQRPAARGGDAPPTLGRPDLPQALGAVVCRLMAQDPAERFQTPAELLGALDELAVPPPMPVEAPIQAITLAEPPAIAPAPLVGPEPTAGAHAARGTRHAWPRLAQAAWLAACGALVAALVAASIWALRRRQSHVSTPPTRPAPERPEPPDRKAAEPVPPPQPPPPPREPELDEGDRQTIEGALAFERDNPDNHAEAVLALRRGLLVAAEGRFATKLRARLAIRQQMLTSQASAAYGELNDRLIVLRSQGRFADALRACQAFPQSLRWGAWGDLVAARFAELGDDLERHYVTLALKATAALQEQRLDEGMLFYKAIADLGIPWMARAVEPLAADAAAYAEQQRARQKEIAARQAVLARRKALGTLTRSFALVYDEIKKRDYAKALETCKALSDTFREGDRGQAIAHLERRLALLAELWAAILDGPEAAIGKSFPLHGAEWTIEGFSGTGINAQLVLRGRGEPSGRTLRQPIWRLPTPQLGKLAEWATERDAPGRAAAKVGLLYLTEGGAAEARQKFQEAADAGEDVAACLDELEAEAIVAAALAAHRQGKWAEGRKLLESALDRFGTTSPVILSHRTLSNALADCRLKLGDLIQPPPPAPELPERLHWLVLLPETRLESAPPAEPLDAHFATPLRRGGPQRLGLDSWRDSTLSLRWTAPAAALIVLAARVSEPQTGDFRYYYAAAGGGQLVLGRRDAAGGHVLASKPWPAAEGAAPRKLTFSLVGAALTADLEAGPSLEATDATLASPGRIVLAAPEGGVLVHELLVTLRPPRPSGGPSRPAPKER